MSHTFKELLTAQYELQVDSFDKDPTTLTGEARAEFIIWNMLALEDEVHEALAELGWKPWASSRHLNQEAFMKEMVDAFHFFMNLLLAANISADDFTNAYFAKRKVNAQRQEDGYTGLAKCPDCHRDVNELPPGHPIAGWAGGEGQPGGSCPLPCGNKTYKETV